MEINMDNLMRNSFGVLTNRCTIDDILDNYTGEDAMFYGNPLDLRVEELQEMLEYFENTEEYEYCGELKELIDANSKKDFDTFLHGLANKNGITNY
tara:strand:+ start:173 stop:460 length:288 start_codon:yes stop_codon:yes gene_type:complete